MSEQPEKPMSSQGCTIKAACKRGVSLELRSLLILVSFPRLSMSYTQCSYTSWLCPPKHYHSYYEVFLDRRRPRFPYHHEQRRSCCASWEVSLYLKSRLHLSSRAQNQFFWQRTRSPCEEARRPPQWPRHRRPPHQRLPRHRPRSRRPRCLVVRRHNPLSITSRNVAYLT